MFFALTVVMISAVFLCVLESARMNAARLHLTVAANTSMDSLFSQYHRKLWEDYRLLGLEHYAIKQLEEEMAEFIEPYFDIESWMPMKLKSIEAGDITLMTDGNGEIFEKEVLDYMKYGIVAEIWDMADIELFDEGTRQGGGTGDISELYGSHADEAAKIEMTLEEINEYLLNISEARDRAESAALGARGSEVISNVQYAKEQLKELPELIEKYEDQAEKLNGGLASSKNKLEEKRAAGEISESTYSFMLEDIEEYESYAAADGERRKTISSFKKRAVQDEGFFESVEEKAEEIMEYIARWEPENEDDELDEEALWKPAADMLSTYVPMSLDMEFGIKDKEKMNALETLKSMFSGEILKLVLPEGAELSDETLELSESPGSELYTGENEKRTGLLDSVYIAWYMSAETGYFGRGIYDEGEFKGSGACEQEYILAGMENDRANLSAVLKRLALTRSGLNLIYLYTDSSKKNEARSLAMMITGAVGITPLTSVITFMILSLWAFGQAVMDVRRLIRGEKVPFMHDKESFDLTIDGLLGMAGGDTGYSETGSGKGLSYRDYLKIFLFFDMGSEIEYRCMDIIQLNIRRTQPDFKLSRIAYSMDARVTVRTRHIFSDTWITEAYKGGEYDLSAAASYSY